MRIRPADENDFVALCAVDTVAAADPKRRDQISGWLDAGCCDLVELDGAVAAYGVLTRHFFGNAFIDMLMVGSAHRRKGLGAALIAHFQAMCAGSKLFTSTNMSNQQMQALLVRAGFRPSGYIDNLDENDPEIVFYSPVQPVDA
ncbi:GNAT family N-acetyltransferase [Ensifer sp.]|jgi:ribosomal protein S18 acetylase RimI-like enzyme|uniref:GNAT family N-acetyltransferase n=1 Tax=Ensifer sp. TaxID=1872086 RepID=UPI002E0D4001|nr:GNAT family N-acetyltransferase [Ensifer sp.]